MSCCLDNSRLASRVHSHLNGCLQSACGLQWLLLPPSVLEKKLFLMEQIKAKQDCAHVWVPFHIRLCVTSVWLYFNAGFCRMAVASRVPSASLLVVHTIVLVVSWHWMGILAPSRVFLAVGHSHKQRRLILLVSKKIYALMSNDLRKKIHKGKCCGIIELLHGNNSNEREVMSDNFRVRAVLIDKALISLMLNRSHCFPEESTDIKWNILLWKWMWGDDIPPI